MDAAERKEILSRYMDHQRRFDAVAAKRQNGDAEVIPFSGPLRELAHAVAVGFRRNLIA